MIKTERLILRSFREEDAGDVFAYLSVPQPHCFECMKVYTMAEARTAVAEKMAHPAILATLGISAGVLCGLFGAGALLAAYFARVTRDDKVYKGSMCMIFAAENIFRVIACSVTGLLTLETCKIAAILALPMLVGLFAGMKLAGKMNAKAMRVVIIVMLMVSGLPLLLTNL